MPNERIFVVDDEEDILELLDHHLSREGYHVVRASSGEQALALVRESIPNLFLLDLMLPGISGLDLCRMLRTDEKTANVPIIIVSAKGEESDVVAGLELGADDYVTKPFSVRPLLARVRAVLRRKSKEATEATDVISIHGMVIHVGRHQVLVAGAPVELRPSEFRILTLLARRPGWVFTRGQIIEAVRGEDCVVTERSVDVQIAALRRRLGGVGDCIETVRGVGYRCKE